MKRARAVRGIVSLLAGLMLSGGVGAAQYTYDNLNRLTAIEYPSGAKIAYSYDAAGNMTYISQLSTTASPPGAPTLTGVSFGRGRATISFVPPANNGGAVITSYTASCSASGKVTRTASGSASPLTVTGLTGGVAYTCSVTATNSGGTSVASAAGTVTPLAMKAGVSPILMLLFD